jgi:hypothetical protein
MKFRKKPVVIDAVQWSGDRAVPGLPGICFCEVTSGTAREPYLVGPHIHTIEGPLHVTPGDWIITGVRGERYPCKPDIFAATYEPVSEDEQARKAAERL